MFNEFRLGYNRRANSNPARPDASQYNLAIPGVGTETVPYFNIGYGIGAMGYSREVGEDKVLQDNLTRIVGRHSIKVGYEMIWTQYSNKTTSLPCGQYNFTGGTALGSRTATWRDPNLHSPYVMNWSAGFQYQIAGTWVVNLTYQGTAGVGTRAQLEHQPNPSVYRVRRKPSTTRYGLSIAAELPLVPTIRGHQLFVEFQPQYLAQWERHCGEALRQRAHPECQLQPLEII